MNFGQNRIALKINIFRAIGLLTYQDSNLDRQIQKLQCYHYTISQNFCESQCKCNAFYINPQTSPDFFIKN